MAYRRFISLLVLSLLAAGGIRAAELGEPRIASYRGQALVADIELSGLDDPAAALQVRVANADVYRGASMSVPPALSSLQLSVVKQGGKQFVHVTSSKPVDTDMLLLFLELGQGASRDVRLATLFLAPDPHPAPPPPPVALLVPVVAPTPPPPVMVVQPAPRVELPVHAVAVVAAPLHFAAVNTALPASVRPAPVASCKASSTNQACVVLDTKNVALQAKLTGLENKIKLLEASLAPVAAAAPVVKPAEAHASATEPKATEPKATAPAPSIIPPLAKITPPPKPVVVKLKKHKPAEAPPHSTTPWLWIGLAALVGLAAIGAIVFLLLRRRAGRMAAAPSGPKPPGIMAGVRNRLMPAKAAPVAAEVEA